MAALTCTCILLLLTVVSTTAEGPKYRICVKRGFDNDCWQLSRTLEAECIENLHGIDCLNNVQRGISDFGRVTPEEALIAANFVQDVVVVGEIRSDVIVDDSLYSTVVLVKQDSGGFSTLRGKKLCHPGFKYDEGVSELLLKEFERTVLKSNNADACSSAVNSDTVDEKELKAVYEFFGPSCRPGPWSILDNYNKDFYNRYGRLCELCDSQEKCEIPNGVAPFMYSLECLLKVDGGDVALTSLNTVKEYFGRPENMVKKSSYRYLCRDGSVRPLDTPCVWSKQPWNLIVAQKKRAAEIKSLIEQKWLPGNIIVSNNASVGIGSPSANSPLEDSLKGLLFSEKGVNKILIVDEVPLQKYIAGYRSIPNIKESTSCGQQIRWCTTSDEEQEKCLWLAQASLGRAIQPVIDCVKSLNKVTCLEDIEKNKADFVTSDAHYGYIARKKGLASIGYPDTDVKNLINTLLVIKNKDAISIQKFGDLKDKKACFPEYGGIEWLSFINTGRNQNAIQTNNCDYGGLISTFVGDSCIPGAHDPVHEVSSATDKDKLCRLCLPIPTGTAVTCNTDNSNLYYGNNGALKCLKEVGDFAVITKGDYVDIDPNEFRVICKNGILAPNPGFNVDPSCALSVTVDSEIVTKRKQPNKNKDIELVLFAFERYFGRDRTKPFEVFNIFNNKKDLLFKDSTAGIVETNSDNVYVKNYANMFAHIDQCVQETPKPDGNTTPIDDGGGANALQTPIIAIATTLILLLTLNLLS